MTSSVPQAIVFTNDMDRAARNGDRLDPTQLRADAAWLLQHNPQVLDLVAHLLRDIRRDFEQREGIREGYEFSHRRQQEDLDRLQHEVNSYREALRLVKRATRDVRVGRF